MTPEPADPPPVNTSPFKSTVAGSRKFGATIAPAAELKDQLSTDMKGNWIGFLEPSEFCTKLMEIDPKKLDAGEEKIANTKFDEVPEAPKLEADMYSPFVSVSVASHMTSLTDCVVATRTRFQIGAVNALVSHFKLRDDSNKKDEDLDRRPDVTGYDVAEIDEKWRWVFMLLWIEFKIKISSDPFHRNYDDTDCIPDKDTSAEAAKTLGQLTLYAAHQLGRQQRIFIISLLICGDHARFIRFDRAGAIVSKHFNYRKDPKMLAEFFWRYDHMTQVERGFDPSAVVATPAEQALLETTADAHVKDKTKRQLPGMELIKDSKYPCYKMTVEDTSNPKNPESRNYIVKSPLYTEEVDWPVGRSTRGYVALDTATKELVFVKDYWRPSGYADRVSEAEVYVALKNADVPHLPNIHLAGDVPDADATRYQETLTQMFLDRTELCKSAPLRVLRHHRIVQDLAYPISSAKDSKEMTSACRDATECTSQLVSFCPLAGY